jgi:protein-tyrosine phosphatase
MIDIHSHILPDLDDGSKSWDMTLAMCRLALQHGTTHIVATPHATDTYTYSRDQVRNLVNELDHRIRGAGQLVFSIGCDFHLSFENIEDAVAHPRRYTIAAKQYLLVEHSDYGIPPQIDDSLSRFQEAGMIPIITLAVATLWFGRSRFFSGQTIIGVEGSVRIVGLFVARRDQDNARSGQSADQGNILVGRCEAHAGCTR